MIQKNCILVDFNNFTKEHTNLLCEHIDKIVSEQNRPTEFIMSSKIIKDEFTRKSFNENPIEEGLVCCISAMEICDTMTVKGNKKLEVNNKHISGFNILCSETTKLLKNIASGDYIVNKITNKLLRNRIFKDEDFNTIKIRNKTTRLWNKLKNQGIIKKVNHSSK